MKKLIRLSAMLLLLGTISCRDKDDTNDDNPFSTYYYRGTMQIGKESAFAFNYSTAQAGLVQFKDTDSVTSTSYYQQSVFMGSISIDLTQSTGFIFSKSYATLGKISDTQVQSLYAKGTMPFANPAIREEGITLTYFDTGANGQSPAVYWTSALGSQTGSNFAITGIKAINSTDDNRNCMYEIIGTFNCKMYSQSSTDTLVFTNGTFKVTAAAKSYL